MRAKVFAAGDLCNCNASPFQPVTFLLTFRLGDVDRFPHPRRELHRIFHHIGRNFVVPHCTILTERPEGFHAKPFKIRSCGVVHLEIQPVLRDEGKEQTVGNKVQRRRTSTCRSRASLAPIVPVQIRDNSRIQPRQEYADASLRCQMRCESL